jgi:hypothetical protein
MIGTIAHFAPAHGFGMVAQREVRCKRKVGGSDPVTPRAQSQRKLGVRFRLQGQAVGEILLFGIAAHVLKRQHGDRRFVGQWKRLGGLD